MQTQTYEFKMTPALSAALFGDFSLFRGPSDSMEAIGPPALPPVSTQPRGFQLQAHRNAMYAESNVGNLPAQQHGPVPEQQAKRNRKRNITAASAAPHLPDETEPLSLADRIERMGRALTADELAEMLTVSRITIFKLAKAGRVPSFRIGTCVRFDPRAVATWLRKM
jgi:excisionase family DNA binding protein